MPVVKGQPKVKPLEEARRNSLLTRLSLEFTGKGAPDGPVIFEIPLEQSDRFDVLVVWEEFKDLRSEDRSSLILQAYGGNKEKIAQALGVTYAEAMEQYLLPYAVLPLVRNGEADLGKLREEMLSEGGIKLSQERVDLRFPTMSMAEDALRRLQDRLPKGYWSVVQSIDPIA